MCFVVVQHTDNDLFYICQVEKLEESQKILHLSCDKYGIKVAVQDAANVI